MKPQNSLLLAAASLLPSAALATRTCSPSTPPTKWTVSEFTYDAPDISSLPGREAVDAVVGLYLTDYSCYGAWNESWGGLAPQNPSLPETIKAPLIWFPCVNSRGRAVDETVSFAVDWPARELHVAHMYTCSDGDEKG